jgi:PAS domain S-box-containing protein
MELEPKMELNPRPEGQNEQAQQIKRLERSLRLLSACNHALVRAKAEPELLQTLCQIMIETGGYRFAWIGYLQLDAGKTVQPVAMAGYEADYFQIIQITWADTKWGQGPVGKAVRAKKPCVLQDMQTDPDYWPWQAAAQERGYRGMISLPLIDEDRVFGALNIYASEVDAFRAEEVQLMTELAADLSYGVRALRAQSDRQRAEAELQASESSLRQSYQQYNDLVDRIPVGVYRFCMRADGEVYFEHVSPRWSKMNQLNTVAILQDASLAFNLIHPEDLEQFLYVNEQARINQKCFSWEGRLIIGGELRWMHMESSPTLCENGDITWNGIQYDITDRVLAEQEQGRFLIEAISARVEATKSRDLLTSVFERMSDGIFGLDTEGRFTYINNRAIALFGQSAAALVGKCMWTEFPHLMSNPFYHACQHAMEQQTVVYLEEYCEPLHHWFENRIHPDANGVTVYFTDVTDRKLAETAVENNERRYASLTNAAPVGIFRMDALGDCIYVNDRWSQITGLSSAEAQGLGWRTCLHPEDRAQVIDEWIRVVQDNHPCKLESRLQKPDGSVCWIFGQAVAECDATGKIVGYIGTITDITTLKTTQELLWVSEERLRLALAAGKQGLYDLNIQTGDAIVNPEYATMLGYDPANFQETNAKWIDRLHPDDRERIAQSYQAYIRGEIPDYSVKFRQRTRVGDWKWILSLGKITAWDEEGHPLRMVGTHTDISDLKQAEAEQLKAQQVLKELKLLENVLDIVLAGYWDWDLANNKEYLSPGYKRMLGYQDAELPNTLGLWQQLIYPADLPSMLDCISCHIQSQGERPYYREVRYQHKNGSLVWVICSGRVIEWNEQGQALRMIGCHIDITDRKLTELQLQQTNERLIQATRLKDEFLASMSHELRTPLNAILGMTEGLQDEVFGSINPQQLKALKTIEHGGSHLLELITDILDVAKIEAGQIELNSMPTDVEALCQSSLVFIRQQALEKQIQLQLKLPLNLPDLLVDERRIRQVLINLLSNAVKFTPAGRSILLEVQDAADALAHNHLRISVIDTGIGIAPENFDKLFQPFVQIDGALNRQYNGTGLGLALVKQMVELHGGQVLVTSEVGVGSCFSIDLPCLAKTSIAADANSATGGNIRTLLGNSATATSPLILLAEDNEDNISSIASYLEASGYRLVLARNGQEAIALARSEQPNLVLMDIQMPVMDGIEAIRQIRRDPDLARLPIIALTALAMIGDRDRCLAAGADEYLSKPIKLKQLVVAVQQSLGKIPSNKAE